MRNLFVIIFLIVSVYCQAQHDTAAIYFSTGSYELTAAHKHSIDSLLYNDVLAPRRRVGIIGYADVVGDEKSNRELSVKRAAAVAAYLQYMGIDSGYIEQVTGAGEVSRVERTGGYPQDRMVAILPGGFDIPRKTTRVVAPGKAIYGTPDSPVIDFSGIALNAAFKLENIYFEFGKYELLKQSIPTLRALAQALKDNPAVKIQIEGHVCCADARKDTTAVMPYAHYSADTAKIPGAASDADLSSYRAYAVRNYLVFYGGIENRRIRCVGYGNKRKLVDPEQTDTDRARNRRVEVRLIAK